MFKKYLPIFIIILLFTAVKAQDQDAYFVTFGKECPTWWGDDDFNQIFFFAVEDSSNPFYLWIYDADCGGTIDEINNGWDTQTKFSIYGGENAFSDSDAKGVNPTTGLSSGTLIKSETFGESASQDGKWTIWGPFKPEQGELVSGERIFKVSVEGVSGNDGNLYKLYFSQSGSKLVELDKYRFFNYEVTYQFPKERKDIIINFIPEKSFDKVTFFIWDGDKGEINLSSATRRVLPLDISANAEWSQSTFTATGSEKTSKWSAELGDGVIRNNDIVMYAQTDKGDFIPIELPLTVINRVENVEVQHMAKGCNKYTFDASKTTDLNLGDQLTYTWDFGDGTQGKGVKIDHIYSQPGEYPITLTVTDNSGTVCAVSHSTVEIDVNQPPVADAGTNNRGCVGDELVFDASRSFDPDGEIKEYNWDFGDGTKAKGAVVKHKYTKPGNYVAKLNVVDDSGTECNIAYDQVDVYINAPPVANAGPDQYLGTTTVEFDGTKSNDPDADPSLGEPLIYTWDFGDGTPAGHGATPVHNYSKPGRYTVKLTVKDKSGTSCDNDVDDMIVIINFPPKAKAGTDQIACSNEEITFNADRSTDQDGNISKYTWDFGDGNKGNGQSVKHKYAKPGIYSVKLIVEDDSKQINNKDIDGFTVTVNNPPVAVAGRDQLSCVDVPVQYDGSKSYDIDGKIVKYDWDFGDGSKGTGANPTHAFKKPGKYNVKLTVTDDFGKNCGVDSDDLVVTINEPPVAVAGENILTCEAGVSFDGSKSYDNDGRVMSYLWDFGDGFQGSGVNPTHVYSNEGTYKVKLTVIDNSGSACNSDTDELELVINASPIADAGNERMVICPDEEINVDGGKSYDSDGKVIAYEWDFGDSTALVKSAKASHSYSKPGNYIATLTVTDNSNTECDTGIDEIFIKVNDKPIAAAGPDRKSCVGEKVSFNGAASYDPDGKISKYAWDFGDGSKAEGSNAEHAFAKAGKYNVKLTVTDNSGTQCNTASDNLTITVSEKPVAVAGNDIETCNFLVSFDGSKSKGPEGVALIYSWDFGDGSSPKGGINPAHTFRKSGTYTVKLTVSDEGGFQCGSDTDELKVTIFETPIADAGKEHYACSGETITFDGSKSKSLSGKLVSYEWDFGDGSKGTGMKPTHSYSSPGVYQVNLVVKDDVGSECNTASTSTKVTINEGPYAEAGANQIVCINEPVKFDGGSSFDNDGEISKYIWDFGDGSKGEGKTPTHAYKEGGDFEVKLTVLDDSELKCNTANDKMMIKVKQPPVAKAGPSKEMIACIGCAQNEVTFVATDSYDPDGDGLSFDWDFGDGSTAKGITVTHAYAEPGEYKVTLTVTDDSGLACNKGTDTIIVKANIAPDPVIDVKESK